MPTLVLALGVGCGGYGPISPGAYQHATALYGICNQQAAARLDEFAVLVERSRAAGELTDQEAGWLDAIVGDARAGNWTDAGAACRRMMTDQVRP